jgi:hypothetical protein
MFDSASHLPSPFFLWSLFYPLVINCEHCHQVKKQKSYYGAKGHRESCAAARESALDAFSPDVEPIAAQPLALSKSSKIAPGLADISYIVDQLNLKPGYCEVCHSPRKYRVAEKFTEADNRRPNALVVDCNCQFSQRVDSQPRSVIMKDIGVLDLAYAVRRIICGEHYGKMKNGHDLLRMFCPSERAFNSLLHRHLRINQYALEYIQFPQVFVLVGPDAPSAFDVFHFTRDNSILHLSSMSAGGFIASISFFIHGSEKYAQKIGDAAMSLATFIRAIIRGYKLPTTASDIGMRQSWDTLFS